MHVELPMPDRFPGSECEAKEGEHLVRVIPTTVYILTVDDLRLLGMQHQLAGRQAIRQCTPQRLRLHGAFAVTNGVSRAEGFHLRALAEPYVNLSTHTAPIDRPRP